MLDLAAYLWELTRSKTGGERGDGPNVKGEFLPNLEPVKIPEAGKLFIKNANYGVSVFKNTIHFIIQRYHYC